VDRQAALNPFRRSGTMPLSIVHNSALSMPSQGVNRAQYLGIRRDVSSNNLQSLVPTGFPRRRHVEHAYKTPLGFAASVILCEAPLRVRHRTDTPLRNSIGTPRPFPCSCRVTGSGQHGKRQRSLYTRVSVESCKGDLFLFAGRRRRSTPGLSRGGPARRRAVKME
jgi:hypothetical protein